jgi:type I restriction enzyme S subunit
MSSKKWESTQLKELASFSQGIQVPINNQKSIYYDKAVRFIRIVDFSKGNTDDIRYIDNPGEKYIVGEDDLVMIRYGSQTAGKIAKGFKGAIANNTFKIIPNEKFLDKLFLYYYLSQPIVYQYFQASQASSTMPAITFDMVGKLEINYPNLSIQKKIASILSTIDDKIELNRQTNQTLEGIAQTLFQEMCMPKGDELPEGWRVGKLGEVCKNVRKTANPKDFETSVPYVGLEHIPRKSLGLNGYGVSSDVTSQKSIFKEYDILFGKLRPYFHKVCIAPTKGICSTDILVIEPLKKEWFSFCINHLYSDELIKYVSSVADGTRMPRVDWMSISNYEISIPPNETIERLNEICLPFDKNILSNNKENQTLIALRDSLLPKLMKGEIEI